MGIDTNLTVPLVDTEPCVQCGAPLAPDQRYCLRCGTRRAEARLPFLDVLVADALAPPAPAVADPVGRAGRGGANAWLRENSPLLGLAGLLVGMLLVGLLIGHWASAGSRATSAAPAQIIRVPATAAAVGTTAAPAAKAAKSSKATGSGAANAKSSAPSGAASVKKLSALKGKQYKREIDKLVKKGTPIATGGKPPPKDNKAAGGGSSFETIG
jgi:hypothetical protein